MLSVKKTILLTDIMFPNKFAKWRLVEIKSFMDEYNADILVPVRTYVCSGINFDFDYDILSSWGFPLNQYDIYIFNPQYNWLQKYNTDDFNGTQFTSAWPADYLIRHKSRRNLPLNLSYYDCVYHIFLCMYMAFNDRFQYPKEKQIIHLYPGGGYYGPPCISYIHPQTKVIPTQNFVSTHIPFSYSCLPILGGPFYYKDEQIIYKNINKTSFLTVCFTSLGSNEDKGAHTFMQVVHTFMTKYPHIYVLFISIGNCPSSPNIKAYPPMDQKTLSEFYSSSVDVILNLETGQGINGFPLGCEAILQGAVMLTTDVHNQNKGNNYNFPDFHIVNSVDEIVEKLKSLHDDRESLAQKSKALQEKMWDLFSYKNTMQKIFDWIES